MESITSCFICNSQSTIKCEECNTNLCKECYSKHLLTNCFVCSIKTCSFTICYHNKTICTSCWNNYELLPNYLSSCNSCSEYCPCCITLTNTLICNICHNHPFYCYMYK